MRKYDISFQKHTRNEIEEKVVMVGKVLFQDNPRQNVVALFSYMEKDELVDLPTKYVRQYLWTGEMNTIEELTMNMMQLTFLSTNPPIITGDPKNNLCSPGKKKKNDTVDPTNNKSTPGKKRRKWYRRYHQYQYHFWRKKENKLTPSIPPIIKPLLAKTKGNIHNS